MNNDDAEISLSSFSSAGPKHEETFSSLRTEGRHRTYWSAVVSGLLFISGSIMYIILAAADMEYYDKAAIFTDDELAADDVVFWDQFYWEADVLFGREIWVSRSQVVYFLAALCFVLLGIIDLMYQPGFLLGLTILLAGMNDLVSAMLYTYNEWLSNVFSAIAVHMFFLGAVEIVYFYWKSPESHWIMWLGDLMFLAGTFIDVVLSYPAVFDTYNMTHANTALAAAVLWLGAAIINMYNVVVRERSLYQKDQIGDGMDSTTYDYKAGPQNSLSEDNVKESNITLSVTENDISDHSSQEGEIEVSLSDLKKPPSSDI